MTAANDTIEITANCTFCYKSVTVRAPRQGYANWQDGALIQDAMPTLTPGEREFLISRICEPCFDATFKE
jgi:hypothetical protein